MTEDQQLEAALAASAAEAEVDGSAPQATGQGALDGFGLLDSYGTSFTPSVADGSEPPSPPAGRETGSEDGGTPPKVCVGMRVDVGGCVRARTRWGAGRRGDRGRWGRGGEQMHAISIRGNGV